jgi:hypothetical protein
MKTTKIKGHEITTWESIDELPIVRFAAFNKYMMIDSGLGNTLADIDRVHIVPLLQVLDNKEKAQQQIQNMRELIFSIENGFNYNHSAYCCLIHSIDGKPCTDISETGIEQLKKRLEEIGVTNGDIKKKTVGFGNTVMTRLRNFFQRIFQDLKSTTTIKK